MRNQAHKEPLMDERYYQTGALSETQCLLISKALKFYAASASPTNLQETDDALVLHEQFADPAGEMIPVDKPD
jgi:hypothetical protein